MDFAFFLQLSQSKNKMKINQLSLKADTLHIFIDFKALQYNRSEVFITHDFFFPLQYCYSYVDSKENMRALQRKDCSTDQQQLHASLLPKDFLHHYQFKSPAFPLPAQKPLWYTCMQAYITEYPFDPSSKGLIAFFWGSTANVILLCNLNNWRKCQSLWNLKIISLIVTDSVAIKLKIWPHLFHAINELVIANHFFLERDYMFINCTI